MSVEALRADVSLRRDDSSCTLIGAGGTLRSDWSAYVNDVSVRIDR